MKNYFRVMLGAKSAYAALCREQGFIGADYQLLHGALFDLALFGDELIEGFDEGIGIAQGFGDSFFLSVR